jgi:2-iminobutanoate/2-iminopropanoate deaminase
MSRDIVFTDKGPIPVSNYSQAVISNGIVFMAGFGPRDPKTNVIEGDIEAQLEVTFSNMNVVLEEAGSSMQKMLRCVVYVLKREHIPAVNRFFEKTWPKDPPARAIMIVSDFGIPGMLVETISEATL